MKPARFERLPGCRRHEAQPLDHSERDRPNVANVIGPDADRDKLTDEHGATPSHGRPGGRGLGIGGPPRGGARRGGGISPLALHRPREDPERKDARADKKDRVGPDAPGGRFGLVDFRRHELCA